MDQSADLMAPRSTADAVYERLYHDIVSLNLLPGSKISEADVGRRFGVSRQPVRDAFKRLGNLDLLEIRPQRATVVRRFSMEEIQNTRFLRLAVELEVIEQACVVWDAARNERLLANLAVQDSVLGAGDTSSFHKLDYEFHQLICDLAGQPMAFETINQYKRMVDRICVLSLSDHDGAPAILEDHHAIAEALSGQSKMRARDVTRRHISRLDDTISEIHKTHSNFFQ